jgi:hypothetical protein
MDQHRHRACALLSTVVMLAAALTAPAALAGDAGCSGAPYRDFDFWLGDWQVATPDGEHAGRNSITSEQSGCLLVERWVGARGNTGTSMNFYDPVQHAWRQVWVSPGVIIDIVGGLADSSMVLEGTIVYTGEARSARFRGTWTPRPDGRVRQFFEEAGADGRWQPWFEGLYRRIEAGVND